MTDNPRDLTRHEARALQVGRLAAEEVWHDLRGRGGFKFEIDEETQEEILSTWARIIGAALTPGRIKIVACGGSAAGFRALRDGLIQLKPGPIEFYQRDGHHLHLKAVFAPPEDENARNAIFDIYDRVRREHPDLEAFHEIEFLGGNH